MRIDASRTRAARAAASLLAVTLVVAGCGGSDDHSGTPATAAAPTPSPPTVLSTCGLATPGWQALRDAGVDGATRGRGPAVVFVNDSGNDPCDWVLFAEKLGASGHRVVVFDYGTVAASAEPTSMRETLEVAKATAGGGRYILVGASLGGRIVIEAAATHPTGLAGIVSLSGERKVGPYRDILADARRVRVPALYMGGREDQLTHGSSQQRQLHAAMGGELLQVPGFTHGTELLTGGVNPKRVRGRVADFVDAHLG